MAITAYFEVTDSELVELRDGLELIATRMLRDRELARDAAQETILRILDGLQHGRVPARASLGAFAYGILRHVAVDLQRRAAREITLAPQHDPPERAPSPLELLISTQDRQGVAAALQRLSDSDRKLLERCYVDGQRITDIAREAGEPEGRVRVRKLRALERLRKLMNGNESVPTSTKD